MPLAVTMKGSLMTQVVDEELTAAEATLNKAGASSKNFIVMDDTEGGHVLININNILTVKEMEW